MLKLYVRPHLGYYVEFWIPQYAGDMGKIEKSQNKMTKLLKHGRLLSPKERNDVLGIESHEERRLRGDLIYICIMGAPRVPPLNPSESIVLSCVPSQMNLLNRSKRYFTLA